VPSPNAIGLNDTTLLPGLADNTPSPQVLVKFAGSVMIMPFGNVSLKVSDLASCVLALLSIVNVKDDRSPRETELGVKRLLKPGRSAVIVKSAVALPLFPSLEVRSPLILLNVPKVEPVTLTVITQLWFAPRRPRSNVMDDPPFVAFSSPSQFCVGFAEAESVMPAGRLSVKFIEVTGVASLVMLNVRVDVLPGPIIAGLNVLLNVGAA